MFPLKNLARKELNLVCAKLTCRVTSWIYTFTFGNNICFIFLISKLSSWAAMVFILIGNPL